MSKRLENFLASKDHVMQQNLLKKLSQEERQMCIDFITENDGLDKNEFALKVNRWLLDMPKPKNFSAMWALVSQANHAMVGERK
jgi:hypothetical protein